ncbi:MAG TPA: DUF4417 domain-containing protein [Myxococcus sp.]|nr:DUF4417 domain-containing protein [Myxococcus sp.]
MNSHWASAQADARGGFFENPSRGCPGKDLCELRGWTCFCNVRRFQQRWLDLGESPFLPKSNGPLIPMDAALPLYVPMLRHGSKRNEVFQSPVVALSAFDLLRDAKQGYGTRCPTAEELRVRYRLRPDAQVLLVSVAKDQYLEAYWSNRNLRNVPDMLARLALLGMTMPNYTSFVDAPSIHTHWNLRRMRKNAEELTAAGIAVVPHLNARTRDDWNFWTALLEQQPAIRYVCKEFQTGLRRYEVGARHLWHIDDLQHRLGRALHPILVGGGRFAHVAARYFERFTIVDSVPFIKTVKRKRGVQVGGAPLKWRSNVLSGEECLDELLSHNVALYSHVLQERVASAKRLIQEAVQLELPLRSILH